MMPQCGKTCEKTVGGFVEENCHDIYPMPDVNKKVMEKVPSCVLGFCMKQFITSGQQY
jgi:hypothetical protein